MHDSDAMFWIEPFFKASVAAIQQQRGPSAAAFLARTEISGELAHELLSALRPEFADCAELRHALEDLFTATSGEPRWEPLVEPWDEILDELRCNGPAEHVARRLRLAAEQMRLRFEDMERENAEARNAEIDDVGTAESRLTIW